MALIYDNRPYKTRIKECLADDFKVAAIKKAQDVFYDKRNTVVADVPVRRNIGAVSSRNSCAISGRRKRARSVRANGRSSTKRLYLPVWGRMNTMRRSVYSPILTIATARTRN